MMNEIASLNRNSGPPLMPTNRWPRSVNSTVMTLPFSPLGVSLDARLTESTRLSGKIDVQKVAASSAWPSNQRLGVIADMSLLRWDEALRGLRVSVLTTPTTGTHRSRCLTRRIVEVEDRT